MNKNCLDGAQCPNWKCGSFGPFWIHIDASIEVWDDGTDSDTLSNIEWDSDSACQCCECKWQGKYGDFLKKSEVEA